MKDGSIPNPSDSGKGKEDPASARKKRLKLAPIKDAPGKKPKTLDQPKTESTEEHSHRLKLKLDAQFSAKGSENIAEEPEEPTPPPPLPPPTAKAEKKPEASPVPEAPPEGRVEPPQSLDQRKDASPEKTRNPGQPKVLKIRKPAQAIKKTAGENRGHKKAANKEKAGLKGLFLLLAIGLILILGAGLLLMVLNPFGEKLTPIEKSASEPQPAIPAAAPIDEREAAPPPPPLEETLAKTSASIQAFMETLQTRRLRPSDVPKGLFVDTVFVPEGATLNPDLGLILDSVEKRNEQTVLWFRDAEDLPISLTLD